MIFFRIRLFNRRGHRERRGRGEGERLVKEKERILTRSLDSCTVKNTTVRYWLLQV
jgi:hypothetical protein